MKLIDWVEGMGGCGGGGRWPSIGAGCASVGPCRIETPKPNRRPTQTTEHKSNRKKKQYAVSFGVELVALNTAASYFHERLAIPALTAGKMIDNMCMINHRWLLPLIDWRESRPQPTPHPKPPSNPTTTTGRLATYAGASNVLARPLGGWASDKANARFGAKGRLWVQFLLVVLDGVFLLRFARARSKGAAAGYLLVFSVFVQAASGSCFALVPYLSRQSGACCGAVGLWVVVVDGLDLISRQPTPPTPDAPTRLHPHQR